MSDFYLQRLNRGEARMLSFSGRLSNDECCRVDQELAHPLERQHRRAILVQGCIQARHHAAAADSTMTDVLGSPGTLNASVPERLPVVVSAAQSCAPRMSAPRTAAPSVAPATTPKAAPLPAAQGARVKKYSVVKGDTYSKIAQANGVSVSALTMANPGVVPKKLKIGRVLHVPVGGRKRDVGPVQCHACLGQA